MASQQAAKEAFLSRIDAHVASLNGHRNADQHRLRLFARDQFAQAEFPGRKDEDWKYTSVRPILQNNYDVLPAEGLTKQQADDVKGIPVPVINGVPASVPGEVLPAEIYVGSLEDAWKQSHLQTVLEGVMEDLTSRSLPVFEALGLASSLSPLFIHVPRGISVSEPIHIKYTISGNSPVAVHPCTILVAETESKVKILESFTSKDGGHYCNTVNNFFLGSNANVEHYRMQSESYDSFHTAQTNVYQERDSKYGCYVSEFGGRIVRHNVHVLHKGENITTNIYGLFIARESQHIDTQSFIDHAIPHCQSNEMYKGILLDRGHGVFNGKIIVRPDAQKTNAFQQNSALVLSEHAVMDSKPQLEIFADDVRCSHGATIGQLDESAMFYLRSRGLNKTRAAALLKKAFLKDVIDNFPSEEMVEYFLRHLDVELQKIADKV